MGGTRSGRPHSQLPPNFCLTPEEGAGQEAESQGRRAGRQAECRPLPHWKQDSRGLSRLLRALLAKCPQPWTPPRARSPAGRESCLNGTAPHPQPRDHQPCPGPLAPEAPAPSLPRQPRVSMALVAGLERGPCHPEQGEARRYWKPPSLGHGRRRGESWEPGWLVFPPAQQARGAGQPSLLRSC